MAESNTPNPLPVFPIGEMFDHSINERMRHADQMRKQSDAVQNREMQEKFAKMGIRWKVEDAIAAGIHPLAALGAQTHSFQPVYAGDSTLGQREESNFFGNLGQDVSRALSATMDSDTREMNKLSLASARLDIEGKAIDNQIRASQLKKLNSTGPALPSPTDQAGGMSGQGNFSIKPSEAISSTPGAPHQQAGAITDLGFSRTAQGGYIPVPSEDVKNRIEDNLFHETTHFLRNNVLPNFTGGNPPDPRYYPLPKGYDEWRWSYTHQQYMPYRGKKEILNPLNRFKRKGFGF